MKKIFKLLVSLLVLLLFGGGLFFYFKCNYEEKKLIEKEKNQRRYEEIKEDIHKELERYIYVRFPTCEPQWAPQRISDGQLIRNAGMDKEKFLDVDGENYCDSVSYATCVEKNKFEFKTYIRCKDYEDSKFVDWDK